MWITFDNRLVSMEEMSHQHMSNIWHNINEIVPSHYTQVVRDDINYWLKKRFGGSILAYMPHNKFEQEHTFLNQNNLINGDNNVVVNGKVIGRVTLN